MTLFHCSVDPKRVQFFTSLSSPKVAKRGIFDEAFHHHLCTLNYPQTVCTTNIKERRNFEPHSPWVFFIIEVSIINVNKIIRTQENIAAENRNTQCVEMLLN